MSEKIPSPESWEKPFLPVVSPETFASLDADLQEEIRKGGGIEGLMERYAKKIDKENPTIGRYLMGKIGQSEDLEKILTGLTVYEALRKQAEADRLREQMR